ncbi:MAG: cytochrome b [Alphaproteobacteria bacterium]
MSSSPASRSRPALPVFDTPERYGSVSIALHWLAALGMIALVITGYVFMFLPRGGLRGTVITLHDAAGYLTLILAFAHVAWRPFNRFPELSAGASWENTLARVVHWLLLGFLIALPLTGWFAHSTGRNPPMFLNWFEVPRMPGATPAYHRASEEVHAVLSHLFLVVFAAHVLGGLKRQFVNRDGTISRMLGRG